MTASKYQTRATLERRQPRRVPETKPPVDPQTRHGSWWAVPDEQFVTELKERQKHSWGAFKDIPVASLTTGENERRHSMGKSASAFAPSPHK